MVFVTVGNASQGFRRLLDAIDHLAGSEVLAGEKVFVQSGHNSNFVPRHCEQKAFLSRDEFEAFLNNADFIICHGGCGTQLQAIRCGKIPVVMPRLKRYGEHVNDHQVQLVDALSREGLIIPAYEPDDLPRAISAVRQRTCLPRSPSPSPLLPLVAEAIEVLLNSER